VLEDVSFSANAGDIVAIFGPNGCGKTTLMNILSGLAEHDGGEFKVEKNNPTEFSYVFQNYRDSLLPWRNNFDNLAFPLELHSETKQEIENKIFDITKTCDFNIDLQKYPYELSGGQQQMLTFVRALVNKPKVLFIDEPFSALDYENNLKFREHLQKYYLKFKPTVLVITHNIEEAVHLAKKIIVLSKSPTKIVDIIENPEPFPRSIDFLKTKEFNEVKDKVLSAFQKGANL